MIIIYFILLLIILGIVIWGAATQWQFVVKTMDRYTKIKPKIAIYSYNFGNFRNELKGGLDNITFRTDFDYYFYTDQDIKSDKWKVIKVPLQPRTKHMNANRVTAKYYKFKKLPKELLNYDYVLHVDNSLLRGGMTKFTPQKIYDLIEKNPNISFFGRKHPSFHGIKDEALRAQINGMANTEYISELKQWLSTLEKEKFKQKFTHTELCVFLRKVNDQDLNRIMPKVFDKLMERELCRDQHVFSYVSQKENFPKNKFLIVGWF